MIDHLTFFTADQGNLLIRVLIAHFLSDFVLQSDTMVKNKSHFSKYMLLHIALIYATTILLTGLWWVSAVIALLHYLIDVLKIKAKKIGKLSEVELFIADQFLHVFSLVLVWAFYFNIVEKLISAMQYPALNYKLSLLLLVYLINSFPVGYLIKFAIQKLQISTNQENNVARNIKIENGGKYIGIFERIIILTFVLLGKYEAIGFLITGKSIIRFADRDSDLRSEYVLVGTMMSYAISILLGVGVKWFMDY